jgi:hypothetical protein
LRRCVQNTSPSEGNPLGEAEKGVNIYVYNFIELENNGKHTGKLRKPFIKPIKIYVFESWV